MTTRIDSLPKAFIWRRLHSLSGLWLVLFLIEHLITNSQAALLLGDSGHGFVRMVNFIHNLPYLHAIEITLLGVPILLHGIWGIRYTFTAKFNSEKSDGTKPYLKYSRNKSYTWQRITSWLLVVLLSMHIVKFRFLEYPHSVNTGTQHPTYYVTVTMDSGLYTVAQRLDSVLIDSNKQQALKQQLRNNGSFNKQAEEVLEENTEVYSEKDATFLHRAQSDNVKQLYIEALTSIHLKKGEVLVAAPTFGTATLFTVRDTFKSPLWVTVYTLFVLSAVFHAFNGLWTSMLTWGWVIKTTAQTNARRGAIFLMIILGFLGLIAVWGTYFLNLKH